ncbi:MAG: hypothetical protein LM550_08885 [Candidatus Contendobacter sp.]|nr:hypothetical protein [Gammaproteobacteria bacterium]MCC8993784.1 hypothetical protein [Candidatus Contendobacter sp.]
MALADAGQWLDPRQAAEQALALQYRLLTFAVRGFARREAIAGETRRWEQLLR